MKTMSNENHESQPLDPQAETDDIYTGTVSDAETVMEYAEDLKTTDAPKVQTGQSDSAEFKTEQPEPQEELKTPAPASMNVTVEYEVYNALDKTTPGLVPLLLIPKRLSRLSKDTSKNWNLTKDDLDDETRDFIDRYFNAGDNLQSTSYVKDKGFFDTTLEDPEAEYVQTIPHGETFIGLRRPIVKEAGGRLLKGAAARARISSLMGTGIANKIPLTHSGLNIELTSRSDADFINLDTMMSNDRVKLGYDTVGMIFHNSHFGLVERVFDFIMDSAVSINLIGWQDLDMAEHIRVTDLPSLYYGMGSTMFPNGYPLDLPCSTGPAVCRHIESVNLQIHRTLWINKTKLTTFQRDMLSRVRHQHTLKDLEDYQVNSVGNFTKSFDITTPTGGKLEITLGVPTVRRYIDAGHRWADEANRAIERAMGSKDIDPNARHQYMANLISVSLLREYSHWISRIRILPGNDYFDGIEDIATALEDLSTDPDVVEKVFEQIQLFIEDATVAIVAIPNFSCPKCGHDHSTAENTKHPELVPIDAFKLFFGLRDRRLWRHGLNQIG